MSSTFFQNPGSMVWANSGTLLKPPANIHNLSELTQLTFAILTIGADSYRHDYRSEY